MEKIYPKKISSDKKDLFELLRSESIRFEENIDTTFAKYENNKLIATASLYKNIIKCVAIDDNFKGGAIFNELMTVALNEIELKGFDGAFVYTKPIYENSFTAIGFKEIERVEPDLIFMQKSHNDFSKYLESLSKTKVEGESIGAVVLNANPFTIGHKYLIEYAAKNTSHLHIFVVSEDASYFTTEDRYNMVKEGVRDLSNVIIHKTDNYLVSSATFPSYFMDEDKSITKIQAKLDAKIFKYHFSKVLDIDKRFVGTEPNDEATRIYNETMKEIFKSKPNPNKPEIVVIPRKKVNEEAISASRVRTLLKNGKLENTKDLIPITSYEYIKKLFSWLILKISNHSPINDLFIVLNIKLLIISD